MRKSLIHSIATLTLLLLSRTVFTSSKSHASLDRIYDQMDEEEDTLTEEIIQDYYISSALSLSEAVTLETHNAFEGVAEDIIISIVSFIRDPINFGMSCKHFWRIISAFATYRIFEENLIINPDRFDLFLSPVSALSVPAALRAFGNGHTRVRAEFLVKNLELAFYSPAFRSACFSCSSI